jgi:hypothetical protein
VTEVSPAADQPPTDDARRAALMFATLGFAALQESANAAKAANVERNLRWLAKEKPKVLPPGRVTSGTIVRYTTSST